MQKSQLNTLFFNQDWFAHVHLNSLTARAQYSTAKKRVTVNSSPVWGFCWVGDYGWKVRILLLLFSMWSCYKGMQYINYPQSSQNWVCMGSFLPDGLVYVAGVTVCCVKCTANTSIFLLTALPRQNIFAVCSEFSALVMMLVDWEILSLVLLLVYMPLA